MSEVPARLDLLLVASDTASARALARELDEIGHRVTSVDNGRDALLALDRIGFRAVILDRTNVGLGAIDILDRIRATGKTLPIIMLSARNRPAETIETLGKGADDHLATPVSAGEIDARLHALLRGRAWGSSGATGDTIAAGDIVVSPIRFLAWRSGVPLDLARIELGLLRELVRHAGDTLTRATLIERAWGRDVTPASNIVDAHIRTLRAKLVAIGGPDPIQTVRGVGYRLRV